MFPVTTIYPRSSRRLSDVAAEASANGQRLYITRFGRGQVVGATHKLRRDWVPVVVTNKDQEIAA